MTREQIIKRFPNASEAFIVANLDHCGLRAAKPERAKGVPLERADKRKAKSSTGSAQRFLIHFRVFAVRPLDWDNYRLKELQDFLCLTGLLPDDNWQIVEGHVSSHKAHSKAEEETEIVIERL